MKIKVKGNNNNENKAVIGLDMKTWRQVKYLKKYTPQVAFL